MRTIQSPEGRHWVIRRRWMPEIHHFGINSNRDLLIAGATIAVLIVIFFVSLPLFAVVVATGVFYLMFHRSWTIEAKTADKQSPALHKKWSIRGWQASSDFVDYAADQLESGYTNVNPADLPFN